MPVKIEYKRYDGGLHHRLIFSMIFKQMGNNGMDTFIKHESVCEHKTKSTNTDSNTL